VPVEEARPFAALHNACVAMLQADPTAVRPTREFELADGSRVTFRAMRSAADDSCTMNHFTATNAIAIPSVLGVKNIIEIKTHKRVKRQPAGAAGADACAAAGGAWPAGGAIGSDDGAAAASVSAAGVAQTYVSALRDFDPRGAGERLFNVAVRVSVDGGAARAAHPARATPAAPNFVDERGRIFVMCEFADTDFVEPPKSTLAFALPNSAEVRHFVGRPREGCPGG